jgi:hypothetical protein
VLASRKKKMKIKLALICLLLMSSVEAAQFGGASRSSGGGSRPSSGGFGGSSRSSPSFGGASRSSSPTTIQSRSSLPTRMSPSISSPSKSTFGGSSISSSSPKSTFGGSTKTPSPTISTPKSKFGGTTLQDRSNLPTRASPSRPTIYPSSAADKALAEKAKSSGTSFSNRQEATSAFKQKYSNSTTYTSRYSTPPSVWPTHIPRTYSYGNTSYNVIYDVSHGGYGYYRGSAWYFYDALEDAAMLSILMRNNNYYHPPMYSGYDSQPAVYVDNTPTNFGDVIIVLAIILGLVLAVVFISRRY